MEVEEDIVSYKWLPLDGVLVVCSSCSITVSEKSIVFNPARVKVDHIVHGQMEREIRSTINTLPMSFQALIHQFINYPHIILHEVGYVSSNRIEGISMKRNCIFAEAQYPDIFWWDCHRRACIFQIVYRNYK